MREDEYQRHIHKYTHKCAHVLIQHQAVATSIKMLPPLPTILCHVQVLIASATLRLQLNRSLGQRGREVESGKERERHSEGGWEGARERERGGWVRRLWVQCDDTILQPLHLVTPQTQQSGK